MSNLSLPPGVTGIHALPADHHEGPWDSVITPPGLKDRLLGTALLVLRHGRRLQQLSGTPHGLVVLVGPPGTGKSTLCQGLAQVAALAVSRRGATTFVEIDPHAFPSEMLGESQRAIRHLFTDTLPELAARCVGVDGRQARKAVLSAIAQRPDLAEDPERLTADDLFDAVDASAEGGV